MAFLFGLGGGSFFRVNTNLQFREVLSNFGRNVEMLRGSVQTGPAADTGPGAGTSGP